MELESECIPEVNVCCPEDNVFHIVLGIVKNNSNLELRKCFLQTIYFKLNFRVRFNLIENDLKSHSSFIYEFILPR